MAKLTSADVGLAIKRQLRNVKSYDEESLKLQDTHGVDYVDAAYPSNLVVQMDNGQLFRVRIFVIS